MLDCAAMMPINRRQFVQAGAAVAAAAAVPARAFGQAPTVMTPKSARPIVICSANGNQLQERRQGDLRRESVRDDHVRRGRARRGRRGSEHQRARPARHDRRLRGPAQRRRRPAARLVLHARAEEAGRRRVGARGRENGVARRPGRGRPDRPPPADGQGRAGVRPAPGLRDPSRPQHRRVAQGLVRVEAAHRPAPLPGPGGPRDRNQEDQPRHHARVRHLTRALLRHDQLRRPEPERGDLRRHHDGRPRLEDPGARRRLADPRRRALRRQRGGRGRLDGARRGQPLQPHLVPNRGIHAPWDASEGRRDGGAQADQGEHDREAAAQLARPARLRDRLLHPERQGRVRGRRHVPRPALPSAPKTARRRCPSRRCSRASPRTEARPAACGVRRAAERMSGRPRPRSTRGGGE